MLIPTVKNIEEAVKQQGRLLTVKDNATIAEAAKKMADNQVGCLVVFGASPGTEDKFVGVITERDIIAKMPTKSSFTLDSVFVKDIMTTDVISCTMETTIAKAEQLMAENKIRHIPIVEDGVPVGMISSRDTIAYHLRSNKQMKAAAEQIAMLSTGLKSLDFDDVIALAINQVPKNFEANCAVLCLDQKGSPTPMIYRKGCQVSQEKLLNSPFFRCSSLVTRETSDEQRNTIWGTQVIRGKICDDCDRFCGQETGLIIPLCWMPQDRGQKTEHRAETPFRDFSQNKNPAKGLLCMCRFNPSLKSQTSNLKRQSSAKVIGSEQLRLYKASLLQELLNTNLTNARLYQNYQRARRDSEIDPLTGISSRRVLKEALKTEYARALRYNRSFSIAIVDLDNFKQINDEAGHAAGDRTLRQLAKIMRQNTRMTDTMIVRYGGDEFVLLMPETEISGAAVLLERLRRQVKTISIPKVSSVTISCGLAEWSGSETDTAEDILRRADTALYEAKRRGRNCVVASP